MVLPWVKEIEDLLVLPSNHDQDGAKKSEWLSRTRDGERTHLIAVGISNGRVRQLVREFALKHKDMVFSELLAGVDYLFHHTPFVEGHVFLMFLLERYRKILVPWDLFVVIRDSWVPKIDYWVTADHLCINVFKYIPVYEDAYSSVLREWRESSFFWERRLSIVAYLKHVKVNGRARVLALENIGFLVQDKSYYVRKAIPWVLRTISQADPVVVQGFLEENIGFLSKTELREASRALPSGVIERLLALYARSRGR